MDCKLIKSDEKAWPDVVAIDSQALRISFRRTIAVADNQKMSLLPLDLGAFPLYSVDALEKTLPKQMAAKGGLLLPMHEKQFAIKIYIGGINAVSGEPAAENMASKLRRQILKSQGSSLQDYVVTPQQHWLDGIATSPGQVRQFVAVSSGSGFSVEAQITGEDVVAGLQFEVTKRKRIDNKLLERVEKVTGVCVKRQVLLHKTTRITPGISSLEKEGIDENDFLELQVTTRPGAGSKGGSELVWVRTLRGELLEFDWGHADTIDHLKSLIEDEAGINVEQQRLIFAGKQLENGRTRNDYKIPFEGTIHMALRFRGGGPGYSISERVKAEMAIAAGGLIKQSIHPDPYDSESWNPSSTTTFNVQILNAELYQKITGKAPPKRSPDIETYFDQGMSFFDIPEAPSNIAGKFKGIKSIGQLAPSIRSKFKRGKKRGDAEDEVSTKTDSKDDDVSDDYSDHGQEEVDYSFLDHLTPNLARGKPKMEFRTVKEIQEEVSRANIVSWG